MSRSPGGTPRVPVAVLRAEELSLWVLERVRRYPRPWQSTLGSSTADAALGLTLSLVDAAYRRDKARALAEANALAQRLRLLLRMATDLKVITQAQLAFAAGAVDTIGRMMGGWLRQQGADHGGRNLRADHELCEPLPGSPGGGPGQAEP